MSEDQEKQTSIEAQPDDAQAGITFTIEDENGDEMECTVLYSFHMEHNDKFYLVYTTGKVDEHGDEVSAFRYNPEEFEALARGEEVAITVEPLTTEVEWAVVADTLKRLASDGSTVDASAVVSEKALQNLAETAKPE